MQSQNVLNFSRFGLKSQTKSNHDDYKSFRNEVCSMIREAKKQDNFRSFGVNPIVRAIYRTLKT